MPPRTVDLVARQADDALDVVGGVVARQLEDDDVAALGLGAEDAAVEGDDAPRERVAAVAVGELGDEQVVADQQRLLHRARGMLNGW